MSTQSTSQWNILNALLLGVLIPLAAATVPWLLERSTLPHDLQYKFSGPVSTKEGFAYLVALANEGRLTEENLEVWLPVPASSDIHYDYKKDGQIVTSETKPVVQVEVNVPSSQKAADKDPTMIVIEIPMLRPGENASISVLAAGGRIGFLSEYHLKQLRVVSKEAIGNLDEPSEELAFLYKVGSWMFILFFILMVTYSIYFEHFMSNEKKEKYLLGQIDKLSKGKP